jgi:hypothetical protein
MHERSWTIPELILIAYASGPRRGIGPLDRRSVRSPCEECSRIGLAGGGRVEHDSYCDRHIGQGGLALALARALRVNVSSGELYKCPMCGNIGWNPEHSTSPITPCH